MILVCDCPFNRGTFSEGNALERLFEIRALCLIECGWMGALRE